MEQAAVGASRGDTRSLGGVPGRAEGAQLPGRDGCCLCICMRQWVDIVVLVACAGGLCLTRIPLFVLLVLLLAWVCRRW